MTRCVVLWNDDENVAGGSPRDAAAVAGNIEAKDAAVAALSRSFDVVVAGTGDGHPGTLIRHLEALAPDVVFNLVEAVRGEAVLEPAIPALLDLLGLPFTGNTEACLALCLHKPRTKALLRGVGLPTPGWRVLEPDSATDLGGLRFPVIVKPATMDASHGIDADSVASTAGRAHALALRLRERFPGPVLAEEFIDGREINAAVVLDPLRVLPLSEIRFDLPPGMPRVVSFDAKWSEDTAAWRGTPVECPAPLEPGEARAIADLALAACRAVGARDVARVDLRLDVSGRPFILEVNPNPDIGPRAGVARALRAAGIAHEDFIRDLASIALRRAAHPPASV